MFPSTLIALSLLASVEHWRPICAVKPWIPTEKLASVATGSGKHTSVHSNENPEMSRTKGMKGGGGEMGEDVDKKDREEWKFGV